MKGRCQKIAITIKKMSDLWLSKIGYKLSARNLVSKAFFEKLKFRLN